MPSPVLPSDAKSIIPDPTSTLCGNFVSSLLRLPIFFWKMISYWYDANGNPTKALVNSALPSGSLQMSACLLDEDGTRLLCDGRSFSQTDLPDLYAAIGDTYATTGGASSPGAGMFRIPDFRARFPVGVGSFTDAGSASLGVTGGNDQFSLVVDNLPAHSHFIANTDTGSGAHLSSVWTLCQVSHPSGSLSTDYFLEATGNPATVGVTSTVGLVTPTPVITVPPFTPAYFYIIA